MCKECHIVCVETELNDLWGPLMRLSDCRAGPIEARPIVAPKLVSKMRHSLVTPR